MANKSTNLGLTFLNQNQVAKDLIVNQNNAILDAISVIRAIDYTNSVPNSPNDGDVYIVGSGNGTWQANAESVALFINGNWEFIKPKQNAVAIIIKIGKIYYFNGVNWVSV